MSPPKGRASDTDRPGGQPGAVHETPALVAAVIYYRPRIADFERMMASLRGRVAAVVLVDGPFEGVSRDIKSVRAERDLVAGRPWGFEVYATESRVWRSEADKRSFAAQLAFGMFSDLARHLLVIDSDEALESDVPIPDPGRLGVARIVDSSKPRGGATMIRVHDLSAGLRWGPTHFEVSNYGLAYSTPHCLPDRPHSFVIRHYGEQVKPHAGYERYNKQLRGRVERGIAEPPGSAAYQSRAESLYVDVRPHS